MRGHETGKWKVLITVTRSYPTAAIQMTVVGFGSREEASLAVAAVNARETRDCFFDAQPLFPGETLHYTDDARRTDSR